MISGKNIVCFASGWEFHPTSKHHVMRELSRENNIIWVNWHCSRRPTLGIDDLKSILLRLKQIRQGPRQPSGSITVLTPWQIPLPESRLAGRLNRALIGRAVHQVLQKLPERPVQLWSFAPDVADFVGCFNEEAVIYYCVDAFGEFSGYNRALIERRERELIDRANVVITTSPPLYDSKRSLHPNVHLIEHGVDHQHLARALADETAVPEDIARLPRPIFGFVGVVGDWVDVQLVTELARRRPGASVVMIGPRSAAFNSIPSLPNLHWLGPRDHRLLPGYLKSFDVGLIPFRQVPLTHNANPIKLYEYLAAGVPTVSTSLPAVKPIPGSVWLADDAAAAADCCDQALRHNTPAERAARSRLMLAHSWVQRLEELSEIVTQAIEPVGRRHDACPVHPAETRDPQLQIA
ncbi:MAG TPA: glycosyltransferase [Phycisphaerae bacterium]|nr:glycosyltransferase [Phycisphaerae bacterium]HOJ75442.1 glycosyltransferase [Phycisphaerae bacterium]HOM52242.1 glycosyltransferase [Phycisphaerae bacterium]HON65858.1 glycosyltransferase [Phycisphaerae bacterium]HOQ84136.1 glycosyltransferase [Phycisphaerae bacterium]